MVVALNDVVQPTQYPQEIEDGVNPRAGDFKALLAVENGASNTIQQAYGGNDKKR